MRALEKAITPAHARLPAELNAIWPVVQMFDFHPKISRLVRLALCSREFAVVLQRANDFTAGCFIPMSEPAAPGGRFSALPLFGAEL